VIPIRDNIPSRTVPWVNISLIGLNSVFFLLELSMGERGLRRFFQEAAVIPFVFAQGHRSLSPVDLLAAALDPDRDVRVFLSMFLHGGWAHLLGNMLYLWIFGDNVEDRMGHLRYLVFYLLCGWIATYAHIWSDPLSKLPSIGASGAIAGVLGAYIALYPQARVVTLLPLGIFWPLVQLPAVFFLGFWFLQQFFLGALSLAGPTAQTGGTAWWAHIGGFLAGVTLVAAFQNPRRRPPHREDLPDEGFMGRRLRGW
jgi:membrane associated rhomboid family serine protease